MIGREKKSCAEVMILKHFLTNMPEQEVSLFVITSSTSLTFTENRSSPFH